MEKKSKLIEIKDIKIGISVGLCLLTAHFFPFIQYMAASFAAILCTQDTPQLSRKMGINRLIITAIGGSIGILVVLMDGWIRSEWIFMGMAVIGVIVTLVLCKITKVPYISAMIGSITFIIVIMVAKGNDRIFYAFLRLIGTLYGIFVSLIVSIVFEIIIGKSYKKEKSVNLS